MNPDASQQLDPDAVNLAKAIRQVESGGNFQAKGKSGEYGAYQYTPKTWASDSQHFLGTIVPLEKATKEQQNEVAYKKIKSLKDQGHNVGAIASIWNSGSPDKYLKDYKGVNSYGASYDVPKYAKSVATAYQKIKNGGQVGADPENPSSTANTTPVQKPEVSAGEAPKDGYSLGGFGKNILKSGAGLLGGLANVALHPIDTVKNLGGLAVGAAEKLIPGTQGQEYKADAVGRFFKDRYGGLDKIKNTFYNDPVGAALDLSTLLTGGGALAGKLGELSGVGRLAEAGKTAASVGEAINPISATTKVAGSIAGAGRKIAGAVGGIASGTGKEVNQMYEAAKAGEATKPLSQYPLNRPGQLDEFTALSSVIHGGAGAIPGVLAGLAATSPKVVMATAKALGMTANKLEGVLKFLEKSGIPRQEAIKLLTQSSRAQGSQKSQNPGGVPTLSRP